MSQVQIRRARSGDASFLAWVMQEADRMGGYTSSTDLTFDFGEERRLAFLAKLSNSQQDSYYHHRRFLVALVDGVPAAALSGYVPDELPEDSFELVVRKEGASDKWPPERMQAVLASKCYSSSHFFKVAIPGSALRVEWVATRPEYRRRGLATGLLRRLLEDAKGNGLRQAFVGTLIGNEPALATYQNAGFELFAECRHSDFQALYAAPGLAFLRMSL